MATPGRSVEIKPIPSNAGAEIVKHIVEIVNNAYAAVEGSLWTGILHRTTEEEIARLISTNELVGAYVDQQLVGCARSGKVNEEEASLGLLVVEDTPSFRGTGLGRALVKFVEDDSRQKGFKRMHLDVLKPRDWLFPPKEFLQAWYVKLGYIKTGERAVEDVIRPEIVVRLATPCVLAVFKKEL